MIALSSSNTWVAGRRQGFESQQRIKFFKCFSPASTNNDWHSNSNSIDQINYTIQERDLLVPGWWDTGKAGYLCFHFLRWCSRKRWCYFTGNRIIDNFNTSKRTLILCEEWNLWRNDMTSLWNDITICRNYVTDTWDGRISTTVVSTECKTQISFRLVAWRIGVILAGEFSEFSSRKFWPPSFILTRCIAAWTWAFNIAYLELS